MLRASPCPDRMVNTVLTTSRLSLQNNGLDVSYLTRVIRNMDINNFFNSIHFYSSDMARRDIIRRDTMS